MYRYIMSCIHPKVICVLSYTEDIVAFREGIHLYNLDD